MKHLPLSPWSSSSPPPAPTPSFHPSPTDPDATAACLRPRRKIQNAGEMKHLVNIFRRRRRRRCCHHHHNLPPPPSSSSTTRFHPPPPNLVHHVFLMTEVDDDVKIHWVNIYICLYSLDEFKCKWTFGFVFSR